MTALRAALIAHLTAELGDSWDCTRVWHAWGVGTMSESDFEPVADRIPQIVDDFLAANPGTRQLGMADLIAATPITTHLPPRPLGDDTPAQTHRGFLRRAIDRVCHTDIVRAAVSEALDEHEQPEVKYHFHTMGGAGFGGQTLTPADQSSVEAATDEANREMDLGDRHGWRCWRRRDETNEGPAGTTNVHYDWVLR